MNNKIQAALFSLIQTLMAEIDRLTSLVASSNATQQEVAKILRSNGLGIIPAIRVLRAIWGLGIREAKDLVDTAPAPTPPATVCFAGGEVYPDHYTITRSWGGAAPLRVNWRDLKAEHHKYINNMADLLAFLSAEAERAHTNVAALQLCFTSAALQFLALPGDPEPGDNDYPDPVNDDDVPF